jgi:hypothetical protein
MSLSDNNQQADAESSTIVGVQTYERATYQQQTPHQHRNVNQWKMDILDQDEGTDIVVAAEENTSE